MCDTDDLKYNLSALNTFKQMFARKLCPVTFSVQNVRVLFCTFNKVTETATKELKLIHLFSICKQEDVIFHLLIS